MSASAQLCLVEDDPVIRKLVAQNLREAGYSVDDFSSAAAVGENATARWDLFILDVMLEGRTDGLDLCEKLKEKSPTHRILILSALGEPSDRVAGLKRGADDYLNKPFEMDELLLRVKGMLMRRSWYRSASAESGRYDWDGRRLDLERLEAVSPDGTVTPLGMKEAMLLQLLIERQGQVVTRDEILNRVWGYDAYPSTRTVDNFIVKLRRLFEEDPKRPKYIQSMRGVG